MEVSEYWRMGVLGFKWVSYGMTLADERLMNQKPMLANLFVVFSISVLPQAAEAHEGALDSYGCHHDKNRGDYHCHEGEFTGLSFDSKVEMVRMLRLQQLNRGHAVRDELVEEDITSADVETKQEPVAISQEEVNNQSKPAEASAGQLPARNREDSTEQQLRPAKAKAKEELSVSKEKKQATSKQSKSKQQQTVRVVSIRPDGTVEYEDLRGARFYLDDNGNKVYMRRKR